ncbi:MAG TPA: YoaK family protein [Moraxellaceae bacterium]
MPLDYLRHLSSNERSPRANRDLGFCLAFIAGAANAGGFLAVAEYTSHMTGIVSAMADNLVLGQFLLVLAGLVSVISFLLGAALCAWLVNWARGRALKSEYALPLMLEALLMLLFGVMGARIQQHVAFYVPYTVLLLCFMMGLQNAIITKISRAEIRTTHVTGLVTDVGIEIGRWLYWRGHAVSAEQARDNRQRLSLHATLVGLFLVGGIAGAWGFKELGFQASIALALFLMLLSVMPLRDDMAARWRA